jgi:hypothetical protein
MLCNWIFIKSNYTKMLEYIACCIMSKREENIYVRRKHNEIKLKLNWTTMITENDQKNQIGT